MIQKISALFVLILVNAISAIAAPLISGVTGNLDHNATIIIGGSSFGVKTVAAPFLWEDWESGTNGTRIDKSGNYKWLIYRNNEAGKGEAIYSTEKPYAGSQSMMRPILAGDDFCTPYVSAMNTASVYISFMVHWIVTAGTPEAVHKWWRITSGAADPYEGNPAFLASNVGGSWGFSIMDPTRTGDENTQINADTPQRDVWSRVELLFVLSEPVGTATGTAKYWRNGQKMFDLSNVVTRKVATDPLISSFLLPAELANATDFRFKVYIDNLYVSTGAESFARVEIGNAPAFASCTQREIQIPSAWANGSITVKANQGMFAAGAGAFLYVIDKDGNVNAQGYPITFGQTSIISSQNSTIKMVNWKNGMENVRIYNVLGKTMHQTPVPSLTGKGNLSGNRGRSNLESGIYFTIATENGKQVTKKFVVMK